MFDFRFNTPIPSLNQGQGSVFKTRECAQSISSFGNEDLRPNSFLIASAKPPLPEYVLSHCLLEKFFLLENFLRPFMIRLRVNFTVIQR
jgi:hypothetical protein